MNPFRPLNKVKTLPASPNQRRNGTVAYTACSLATVAGGKTCKFITCTHNPKDYVWVLWPGEKKLFSYHHTDLELEAKVAPKTITIPVPAEEKKTEATEDSQKESLRDEYLDKAKQAIKDKVAKAAPASSSSYGHPDFWKHYHGFTKVKYDRYGRAFLHEIETIQKPVIPDNEIDWSVYNGYKKGSLRKES